MSNAGLLAIAPSHSDEQELTLPLRTNQDHGNSATA